MQSPINNFFSKLIDESGQWQINPITLSFKGKFHYLEEEFKTFFFEKYLLVIRLALGLGIILYALFGILDAFLIPEKKYVFWFIRFGIVIPFALFLFYFTFSKQAKRIIQFLISLNVLSAGLGIIAMIIMADPPVTYSYYAGIIIVLIFAYTIAGLRFIYATIVCWMLIIVYELVAIFIVNTPVSIIVNNNFFFITANLLAMFASYYIEFSSRRDFYLVRLLNNEKDKVSEAKNKLEDIVEERTLQLNQSNKELKKEVKEKNKLIEQQKDLQEQLIQSQKMEAIGLMAGGVAHDFNNILTVIKGYSDFLLLDKSENDSDYDNIYQIREAGTRAESLTRQLLAFSRKQLLQPKILDANSMLRNLEKMIRRLITEDIELVFKYSDKSLKFKADPGQLEQVILNLVINASDAMPKGGKLIVKSGHDYFDEKFNKENPDAEIGEKVLFSVSDTGIGMDSKTLEHIYEPFYTTKSKGKGTGLGLSTVYGIVKQSDGFIKVESEKGIGTVFYVYFNAVDGKTSNVDAKENAQNQYSGSETILLIEDDDAVREYAERILKNGGYKVFSSPNGKDALDVFIQKKEEINFLITDVIMPGMSGKEIAEKLKSLKPDMKQLFISGYTDDIIAKHGIIDEKLNILQKPFTPATLKSKIRNILDS